MMVPKVSKNDDMIVILYIEGANLETITALYYTDGVVKFTANLTPNSSNYYTVKIPSTILSTMASGLLHSKISYAAPDTDFPDNYFNHSTELELDIWLQ